MSDLDQQTTAEHLRLLRIIAEALQDSEGHLSNIAELLLAIKNERR
jgi:hypothetical protein